MSTISAPTSEPLPQPGDLRAYQHTVWRLVEAQHRISTNRLVASLEEQALLESLVEEVKPAMPAGARHLHYLLATPFRYGHSRASRFRRAGERPGILYASEHLATAVAEAAWWRMHFLSRSPGLTPPRTTMEHTAFSVAVRTDKALDLSEAPFVKASPLWTARDDYGACQRFAAAARVLGCQAIRYASVRDPERRANVALLEPGAILGDSLRFEGTWHFRIEGERLIALGAFPSQAMYQFRAT